MEDKRESELYPNLPGVQPKRSKLSPTMSFNTSGDVLSKTAYGYLDQKVLTPEQGLPIIYRTWRKYAQISERYSTVIPREKPEKFRPELIVVTGYGGEAFNSLKHDLDETDPEKVFIRLGPPTLQRVLTGLDLYLDSIRQNRPANIVFAGGMFINKNDFSQSFEVDEAEAMWRTADIFLRIAATLAKKAGKDSNVYERAREGLSAYGAVDNKSITTLGNIFNAIEFYQESGSLPDSVRIITSAYRVAETQKLAERTWDFLKWSPNETTIIAGDKQYPDIVGQSKKGQIMEILKHFAYTVTPNQIEGVIVRRMQQNRKKISKGDFIDDERVQELRNYISSFKPVS